MRGGTTQLRRITLLLLLVGATGCTRHFFRERADCEAAAVLRDKDQVPGAKIEQYHVYPDRRARFADATNPDRPPMPPDDPAARMLSPCPQKPGKAGIARVENNAYLDLLEAWDTNNRAESNDIREADVIIQTSIRQAPEDRIELPPPRGMDKIGVGRPYRLKQDQAVELGIINSREFQNRREDLYLLALPVTLERFGFAAQFFAAESNVRERTGFLTTAGEGDRWRISTDTGFTKVFSTGALLLFQYANRTVINLSNNNGQSGVTSFSTLNLDIVQPFLRGGGRAVTLEALTQAERNLVYEIRDFARFRREYFQFISGGANLDNPLLTPAGFGRAAVIPGNISLNAGNPAKVQSFPTAGARVDLSLAAIAPSQGFLPTVLVQGNLEIEKYDVKRLDSVLKLFEAYEGGGRVSSLQVGQVQLRLLQAQSKVLLLEQSHRDAVDNFKLQMGIQIEVPLELDDDSIRGVMKHFVRYEEMIAQFNDMLKLVDKMDAKDEAGQLRDRLVRLITDAPLVRLTKAFRTQFPARWQAWQRAKLDDKTLNAKLLDARKERNRLLDDKAAHELKEQPWPAAQTEKLKVVEREIAVGEMEQGLRRYEATPWRNIQNPRTQAETHLALFRDVRNAFSEVLGEASNERLDQLRPNWPELPPIVLEGVNLVADKLEPAYDVACRTALENRLDLMNIRAKVVDAWRQIAVQANALQGVFNVGYHMDSTTPPTAAKPFAFSGSDTRHQLFLNFELPLVRLSERNAYRAGLIAYQRARRNLMANEDQIVNQIRAEVRQLQVLAKNYKIQQQAVELAYLQVESSLETFQAPPDPKTPDNAGSTAALTQQLLNAYSGLPQEQSKLLTIWINYQIARQQLYVDLELLPLDFRGVWIDEFASQASDRQPRLPPANP